MSKEGGFSIIELMITVALISLGLLVFGAFTGTYVDKNDMTRMRTVATTLAQDKLEYFKNQSIKTTLSNALDGSDVVNASGAAVAGGAYARSWTVTTSGNLATVSVAVNWSEKSAQSLTLATKIAQ